MDIIQKVTETIQQYKMLSPGETVVVAVSGGPDSVALFHILWQLRAELDIRLHIAHLNHGLRGQESADDLEFVTRMARQFDCPATFETADIRQLVQEEGGSIEETARKIRYDFLWRVARETGATRIATGHNANDRAETVLMWLLRGTGPAGLRGIAPVRQGTIIRPLIHVTREEIEEYLNEQGLTWRQDSSNQDPRHLRNRIRNELLPLVRREYSPSFVLLSGQLADLMEQEQEYFEREVERLLPAVIESQERRKIVLDIQAVLMYHLGLQRRLVRQAIRLVKGDLENIGFDHVKMVLNALCCGKPGAILHLRGGLTAERTADRLILRTGRAVSWDHDVVVPGLTPIPEIDRALGAELVDARRIQNFLKSDGKEVGFFDWEVMRGRLRVRTRRRGDMFRPLGMTGRKKLQDFFVDEKIPRLERDEIALLTVNEEIAWVVGKRAADPFKVTERTQEVLRIEFSRL